MKPHELANRMNTAAEPVYIPLAKAALWITAGVLVAIVGASAAIVAAEVYNGRSAFTPEQRGLVITNVIAACQVLSLITLAVLGYRGGRRAVPS